MRVAIGAVKAGVAIPLRAGILAAVVLSLAACSSSRDGGGSSSLGDSNQQRQPGQQQAETRQPSAYDNDGPPPRTAEPVYRGGRDPVSGRAAEWPPAAQPGNQQMASAPPQPGYPPQSGYGQPSGYPPPQGNAQPQGYPQSSYPPNGYAPPTSQGYPPSQGYEPLPNQPSYQQPGAPSAGGPMTVEVRKGDTLYRIARAHNVTVADLMQANGLRSQSIKQGQRLTIPAR